MYLFVCFFPLHEFFRFFFLMQHHCFIANLYIIIRMWHRNAMSPGSKLVIIMCVFFSKIILPLYAYWTSSAIILSYLCMLVVCVCVYL